MKPIQNYFYALAVVLFTTGAIAQNMTKTDPVIKKEYQGVVFSSDKSLVENLETSDLFSYSNAILSNPNLKELTAEDSYTIFLAPDSFFNKMDKEEREAFLASSNEYVQKQVLNTFIIPGRLDSRSIMYELEKRDGKPLYLKTLNGKNLGVKMKGKNLVLFDSDHQVKIKDSDFYHSKGFFHITDGYFMPESEK